MDIEELLQLNLKISESFSPSAPIDQQTLFSGRFDQIINVINAVSQRGQHVVLYGERGVGKTSLARVISQIYAQKTNNNQIGYVIVNCDPTESFSSLWRKVFREIPLIDKISLPPGFTSKEEISSKSLSDYLPNVISPDDIRVIMQKLGKTIIVLDELDRIKDRQTTTLLADTIKCLSDHSIDTTLILVGVADSVDSLIEEHQSVERALVQIRMPRMSTTELEEIISKGEKNSGIKADERAKKKIARLSQGLPHYTHLLALHSFQHAVAQQRKLVDKNDVNSALKNALAKAQQSIINNYIKATSSPRQNLYPHVLLACALAKCDNLGFFSASDVRLPMKKIMGKPFEISAFSQHLSKFCEENRGPILQRVGERRRYRFRFINPLMQPYVVMNGVNNNLIKESDLDIE